MWRLKYFPYKLKLQSLKLYQTPRPSPPPTNMDVIIFSLIDKTAHFKLVKTPICRLKDFPKLYPLKQPYSSAVMKAEIELNIPLHQFIVYKINSICPLINFIFI